MKRQMPAPALLDASKSIRCLDRSGQQLMPDQSNEPGCENHGDHIYVKNLQRRKGARPYRGCKPVESPAGWKEHLHAEPDRQVENHSHNRGGDA